MRVYHVPNSRSFRPIWLLEEIGAPYDVTVLEPEQRQTPEHLARHPLGRVPVIEDDEGFVFESAGICLHIADCYPDKGFAPPPGTRDRALVYQWVFFAMTEVEAPIVDVFYHRDSESEVDKAIVEAATERFRQAAQVIENALDGKEYLVGGRFSVADLIAAHVLSFARTVGLADGLPNIAAYLERIEARPAFERSQAVGAPAPA